MYTSSQPLTIAYLLVTAFWLSWWFKMIVAVLASAAAYMYHLIKINTVKHEKSDLQRQLLEKAEILSYALRNEQKAKEEAEQANRYRSDLLTKISHEVRTPMNAVMGMAALLNETDLNEEQKEYANTIISSGDSLLLLVNDILMNDILEFSKAESGKQLEPKPFNLHTTVEEVLDVFALKAAQQEGLDLLYNISENVPVQIVSDDLRLRQILMNLVENAVKYTTWGEVFVGVQILEYEENNRIKLEFEVRDTGTGMTVDKTGKLSRDLARTKSESNEAAGIGLTICKKLVDLMGGAMQVKSDENGGTSFKFTIWANAMVQSARAAATSEIAGLEGKRVLIADDNATAGHLLKKRLEKWNLAVVIAESAKKALEILEVNQGFDLVLADMQMPGMDGIDLAQWIKQQYPELPVILLNKTGDEAFRKHPGLFASVLNKPVRQHILSEQVLSAIRHKDGGPALNEKSKQKLSVDFAKKYPLNILIAEDNPVNQLLVTKVLKKLGYEAHVTNNGKEVLEEVSHNNYDLILMDVQMPEMDGLDATKMIRLCLSVQPVIIAMTANTLQGDRDECLKAGMDDYISKPVKLEELVSVLEKWALQVKETH